MEQQVKTLDKRSFPEVWASLDKAQKAEVKRQLAVDRVIISYQTVYNWSKGKCRPALPIVRNAIAASLGKVLGAKYTGDTLFPAR